MIALMVVAPVAAKHSVNWTQALANVVAILTIAAFIVALPVWKWVTTQHQRNERIDAVVLGYTDQAGIVHPGIGQRFDTMEARNSLEHSTVVERLAQLDGKVDALDNKVTTTAQIAAQTATATTTLINTLANGETP